MTTINGTLDRRFSEADEPTSWSQVRAALTAAELYWLTTVRADGRPHVTPLVGLWDVDGFVFCTGAEEQKARNIGHGAAVAVTTGVNTWKSGLDVVVEGSAVRVRGRTALRGYADAYREKYSNEWDFAVDDAVFDPDGVRALVFRVTPAKVIGFAKSPHGQTTFRF